MNAFDATMILEGEFDLAGLNAADMTRDEIDAAMTKAAQFLIDAGAAWKLGGRISRLCRALIDAGSCVEAAA